MAVEELIQFARGDMPTEEIKQGLAEGMLKVWKSPDNQVLIEREATRLAHIKVERMIRDAHLFEKGSYGRPDVHKGWAIPILREVLIKDFNIPSVIEAIRPEIDAMVQESMGKVMANIFINGKQV